MIYTISRVHANVIKCGTFLWKNSSALCRLFYQFSWLLNFSRLYIKGSNDLFNRCPWSLLTKHKTYRAISRIWDELPRSILVFVEIRVCCVRIDILAIQFVREIRRRLCQIAERSKCYKHQLQDFMGSYDETIPGPRLNIKTVLSTYGDFHVKDKTAVRTSYL